MRAPTLGKRRKRAKVPTLQPARRKRKAERDRPPTPTLVTDPTTDPTEPGRTVQGKRASNLEWATYKALRSLGYDDSDIAFQLSVFGGREIAGGQVLDFVVRAGPRPVVVDVRGARWHGTRTRATARDRWREIQLSALPDPPRVVIVWEEIAHNWRRLRALLLRELGAK